jgi:hypothetical protein
MVSEKVIKIAEKWQAYRQDQDTPQDSCHHDEQSAAKENEKLELLPPVKSSSKQHLKDIPH